MAKTLEELIDEAAALGLSIVLPDGSVLGAETSDPPGLWVKFASDGIPGWFGPEPVEGAEFVEAVAPETLIACRRTKAGKWVKRVSKVPADPTPQELARQADEEFQVLADQRRRAVADALREEADPLLAEVFAGELDKEVWLAKRAEIRARYPKPERPT